MLHIRAGMALPRRLSDARTRSVKLEKLSHPNVYADIAWATEVTPKPLDAGDPATERPRTGPPGRLHRGFMISPVQTLEMEATAPAILVPPPARPTTPLLRPVSRNARQMRHSMKESQSSHRIRSQAPRKSVPDEVLARKSGPVMKAPTADALLRRSLGSSLQAMEQHSTKLRETMALVTQLCPVSTLKALQYRRNWGAEVRPPAREYLGVSMYLCIKIRMWCERAHLFVIRVRRERFRVCLCGWRMGLSCQTNRVLEFRSIFCNCAWRTNARLPAPACP